MNKKEMKKVAVSYAVLGIVILGLLYFFNLSKIKKYDFTYDEFMNKIQSNEIKEISVTPRNNAGLYEIKGRLNSYSDNEIFYVDVPLSDEVIDKVVNSGHEFKINMDADPNSNTFLALLLNVFPTILLLGLGFYLVTRQMGTANKSMDFGRSRAHLSQDNNQITFKFPIFFFFYLIIFIFFYFFNKYYYLF